MNFLKTWLPKILDKLHTHWERLDEKVCDGAIKYAIHKDVDHIFCGHTHVAKYVPTLYSVEYWNSGSWVDKRGTYITLGEEGVQLNEY